MICPPRIFRVTLLIAVFCLCLGVAGAQKPLVLFDEGHAQRAGNADWVINGGFSDFADAFKANGCEVRAISTITAADLARAAVLVLPEPNTVYTAAEQEAIVAFVMNGGGLYAIADHDRSDRNGDGIDSVGIFNQFLPRLGMKIDKLYFTEAPVAGSYKKTELTKDVRAVGTWGGTSVTPLSSTGVSHITVSQKNGSGAFIATVLVGPNGGKVVAMGDSSPYDDGSGDPRDKLHDGYNNPKYDHGKLAHNSIRWLLRREPVNRRQTLAMTMRDLDRAHQTMRGQACEKTEQFIDGCQLSIRAHLKADKSLADVFSRYATTPIFSPLQREFNILATFDLLHQAP
jgi:hypothetical protein